MSNGTFDEDDKRPGAEPAPPAPGPDAADSSPWPYEPDAPQAAETAPPNDTTIPLVLHDFIPESAGETARKTGLAWSAGIVLFSSVVFMMVIGWLADLVLGSSPWGLVAGIVLGSVIGFLQFFRITASILKPAAGSADIHTLKDDNDDRLL